jgi:polyribonucleotide nucleotidyltransferase
MERYAALAKVKEEVLEKFADAIEQSGMPEKVGAMFEDLEYRILRSSILDDGMRTDGRKVDQIRQTL